MARNHASPPSEEDDGPSPLHVAPDTTSRPHDQPRRARAIRADFGWGGSRGESEGSLGANFLVGCSEASLLHGAVDAAIAQAQAALKLGDQGEIKDKLSAEAELAYGLGLLLAGRMHEAQLRAETILMRGCADDRLAAAFHIFAHLAWHAGRAEEALVFLRACLAHMDSRVRVGQRLVTQFHLAVFALGIGELSALAGLSEALTAGAPGAAADWDPAVDVLDARLLLESGRIEEAEQRAQCGLALAEQRSVPFFIPMACATLAAAAFARGDVAAAGRALAHWHAAGPSHPGVVDQAAQAWAEVRLTEARCGVHEAMRVLEQAADSPRALMRLLLPQRAGAAHCVRIAVVTGNRAFAATAVQVAELLADGNPGLGVLRAEALHARGLLRKDSVMLDQAALTYPAAWAAARATEDAGLALATSDATASRERLGSSLAGYETTGALGDVARVRQLLRQASRGAKSRRLRAVSGWESLTASEHRIAMLVAEGLSNARIADRSCLSRHTVDFHLRQVYRKLDLRSRVELACLVQERKDHAIEG